MTFDYFIRLNKCKQIKIKINCFITEEFIMKRKNICILTLSAMLLLSSSVYAQQNEEEGIMLINEEDGIMLINEEEGIMPINDENNEEVKTAKISIDGETLEDIQIFNNENDIIMVPVRAVAEKLGFEVEWHNDTKTVILNQLPVYVTFSIGENGYTIAKTAPMPLEEAPILVDGTTYAPISLFSDLLEYDVNIDNDIIDIKTNN